MGAYGLLSLLKSKQSAMPCLAVCTLVRDKRRRLELPLGDLVAILEKSPPTRVPGTVVFLTSDPVHAPTALLHSHKHCKVLHQNNAVLTIETAPLPSPEER